MFRILRETNFDFMSRRNLFLGFSAVLVLASVGVLLIVGLNLGIEFSGGTELRVRYREAPNLPTIRDQLQAAGFTGQSVTSIGDPSEHEIYIRLAASEEKEGDKDQDPIYEVLTALRAGAVPDDDRDDLNIVDQKVLQRRLTGAAGMTEADAEQLAAKILERRKEVAIFNSPQDLAGLEGMTPAVLDELERDTFTGPVAVRSQSYIGPAIGHELMAKALLAIVGSLIGMLIYIWIRFQVVWGCAAVVALAHDTVVTLGLFVVFGKEMSLPVVAAFLTLIGYSVNDTVVVFDRIRENMRLRAADSLETVINASINQTLSRTVITSGLTFIVVLGLLLLGGAALNPFAFVLTVGVVVGTYSSIYIASPILVLWKRYLSGKRGAQSGTTGARRRVGKATT